MLNNCVFVGRMVRDPELNHTGSDIPVTRFTIAVDRGYKDESGEKQADFIDVVAWRDQAENVVKYLSKGSPVAVEGRLQIRSYDDSQGIRRKAAEIIARRVVFLPNGNKKSIEDPPLPEPNPWDDDEDAGIPI